MMRPAAILVAGALALGLAAAAPAALAQTPPPAAYRAPHAVKAPILALVRAGRRLVAVGDYGTALLSDDDGRTWRQAAQMPTRETLTAASFIDGRHGWAVGHGGIVLATRDGGETWERLHSAGNDVVLFSVRFANAEQGLAVGAFGHAMETRDGGRSWRRLEVARGEQADRHLYHIFAGADSLLWITAEAGTVFRSGDGGASFTTLSLPYKGSIWSGLTLQDGSVLVAGMRGHVLHSTDQGRSWREVASGTDQALTAGVQRTSGEIVLAGLGGTVLRSRDGGRSFSAQVRPERQSHTGLVEAGGALHTVSLGGLGGVLP